MSSVGHVGQASTKCGEWCKRAYLQVRSRLQAERGSSLIEYALLVSLIALVCVSALRFFQGNVSSKLDCSASQLNSSTGLKC